MADRNVTVWTCDRCDKERDMENRGQPDDWTQVRVAHPPNSAEPQRYGDLCSDCHHEFVLWWERPKNVAVA